ncbi:MAG: hypothetical protein ABL907_18055 [Hyphomicrobium sp.]
MAYADGVLDKTERARVDAILAQNPKLMAKVGQFERTRQPVQEAYDAVLNEPVPAALLEQIRRAPIGSATATVTDFAAVRLARNETKAKSAAKRGQQLSWGALAIAASVCAVIGTGGGWAARSAVESRQAQERTAALVQIAVESVRSDSEVALPNGAAGVVRVMPAVTFVDKDQRYCRRYRLTGDALSAVEGLACRDQTGSWQVLAQQAFTQTARGKVDPGMRAAGEQGGINLAAIVNKIMDGDYLAGDREAELIARKWKP